MTKLNEVISKLPQEQKERLRKKARHYASIYSGLVLDKIGKNEAIRRIIKRVLEEEGLI